MTRFRPAPLTTQPRVSVVVPCYNYGRFLPGVVASLLRQPGVELDILIIDDCSSDSSAAVAQRLAREVPQVSCIVHTENKGHIATYNEGLALATGEYVVLLSADDLLTDGSLTRSVALMEHHPSVGMVYGYSMEFVDENSLPEPTLDVRNWTVWSGREWLRECCRQGKNMVHTPEVVMRTSVYRQLNGYEPEFPHAADFYMWLQAAARSDIGRVNGATAAYYRVHGSNMHLTTFAGVITDLRERVRTFERFFRQDGVLVSDSDQLSRLARKGMSDEAMRLAIAAADAKTPDLALADAYAEVARSLRPEVVGTLRWRYLELSRGWQGGLRCLKASAAITRLYQNLQGKFRWRRWRWRGL